VRRFEPSDLFVQQLNFHGRFAQFLAYTGEFAIVAIKWWFLQRFLACVKERLTPGGETGGRYPQFA
jgi:hypothetical protein